MLPPPKRKLPTAIPSGSALGVNKAMAVKPKLPVPTSSLGNLGGGIVDEDDEDDDKAVAGPSSSMMLPPTMARKVKKKEEEEVPLDLFGLCESELLPLRPVKVNWTDKLASAPTPSIPSSSSQTALKPPQITSAPAVADFIPPPPTPEDPYPGYYQLPGGQWAAYDPEYYHGFFAQAREDAAAAEEEDAGGRMGKHWADYDQSAELQNIQASEGISEAKAAEARRQTAMPKRNREEFDYKVNSIIVWCFREWGDVLMCSLIASWTSQGSGYGTTSIIKFTQCCFYSEGRIGRSNCGE